MLSRTLPRKFKSNRGCSDVVGVVIMLVKLGWMDGYRLYGKRSLLNGNEMKGNHIQVLCGPNFSLETRCVCVCACEQTKEAQGSGPKITAGFPPTHTASVCACAHKPHWFFYRSVSYLPGLLCTKPNSA